MKIQQEAEMLDRTSLAFPGVQAQVPGWQSGSQRPSVRQSVRPVSQSIRQPVSQSIR